MILNKPRKHVAPRYFALRRVMRYPNGKEHKLVIVRGDDELTELIGLAAAKDTLHQLTPEMTRSAGVTLSAVEGQLERGEFEQL